MNPQFPYLRPHHAQQEKIFTFLTLRLLATSSPSLQRTKTAGVGMETDREEIGYDAQPYRCDFVLLVNIFLN